MVEYRPKIGANEDAWREVNDITTTEYDVTGLTPFTVYELRVSAVNSIGRGMHSESVETTTGELGG